jgi:hypothetical protein
LEKSHENVPLDAWVEIALSCITTIVSEPFLCNVAGQPDTLGDRLSRSLYRIVLEFCRLVGLMMSPIRESTFLGWFHQQSIPIVVDPGA